MKIYVELVEKNFDGTYFPYPAKNYVKKCEYWLSLRRFNLPVELILQCLITKNNKI